MTVQVEYEERQDGTYDVFAAGQKVGVVKDFTFFYESQGKTTAVKLTDRSFGEQDGEIQLFLESVLPVMNFKVETPESYQVLVDGQCVGYLDLDDAAWTYQSRNKQQVEYYSLDLHPREIARRIANIITTEEIN